MKLFHTFVILLIINFFISCNGNNSPVENKRIEFLCFKGFMTERQKDTYTNPSVICYNTIVPMSKEYPRQFMPVYLDGLIIYEKSKSELGNSELHFLKIREKKK